jgi:uridylate kinase
MHMVDASIENKARTVISLGGSIIVPDEVDTGFLALFRDIITARVAEGDTFFIITGGGKTCRKYQAAVRGLGLTSSEAQDWIGIYATRFNGELMRIAFGELAYGKLVNDPSTYVPTSKPVIVGAGHEPGCSSDMDAVQLAKSIGAKRVINLSNVKVVYDNDPKTHPDAKPMNVMTWAQYRAIIPAEWTPGLSTPFDPIASAAAEAAGLEVVIALGTDLDNLKNILLGNAFVGTTIS